MRTIAMTLTLLAIPLGVGCSLALFQTRASIPPVDQVRRIKVTQAPDWTADEPPAPKVVRLIEDRAQIARIIRFLGAHNNGWHTPMDTFPVWQFSIDLQNDEETLFTVMDLGNAISRGGNELRRLTRAEMLEFRNLIQVSTAE